MESRSLHLSFEGHAPGLNSCDGSVPLLTYGGLS